jgi:hypothetical protein
MYRALEPGVVKYLDMDQPMQSMGYFIGGEFVCNQHRNSTEVLFCWSGVSSIPLHLQGIVSRHDQGLLKHKHSHILFV